MMFSTTLLLTLLAVTTTTLAQSDNLSITSIAFSSSTSAGSTVYDTTTNADIEAISAGPPAVMITSANTTATYLALMAYNYTASADSSAGAAKFETVTHFCWLQSDLVQIESGSSGIVLDNATDPLVPYHVPQFDGPFHNLTIQVFEETSALSAYLGSPDDKTTYMSKVYALLNDETLLSTARDGLTFTVTNTTGQANAPLPGPPPAAPSSSSPSSSSSSSPPPQGGASNGTLNTWAAEGSDTVKKSGSKSSSSSSTSAAANVRRTQGEVVFSTVFTVVLASAILW